MKNLIDQLKPFRVKDNLGTDVRTWTLNQARAWLPYCGDSAVILQHGVIIESRQVRSSV